MVVTAASSVRATRFGAHLRRGIGFRCSQRRATPCSCLRSPRPAVRLLCGGAGAHPRSAVAAASADQWSQQLGELEAEEEAGSALGPPRTSPFVVREEMARGFNHVRCLSQGAVYLGSSRVLSTHPHFLRLLSSQERQALATRRRFLSVSLALAACY
ncbi:unnamed protein product [Urochloa humidicola]